jgi:DNA-binding transcriptional regulator YdaS (Cro superfamily)
MDTRDEALLTAINLMGTSNALAAAIGVTPQALSQWKRVPPLRVLDVERASGVPRHELRPDLYPPPILPAQPAARNSNLTEALP